MESWLNENLSSCLEFPVPEEMTTFILSLKFNEIDDYFATLLNISNAKHRKFLEEFKHKINTGVNSKQTKNQKKVGKKVVDKQEPVKIVSQSVTPIEPTIQSKKKKKFVNLYTSDGKINDVVLLKGRIVCNCQATKHNLINNCINCGRIVCKQEGSGPCLFCGNFVCTPEEQKVIDSSTKQGNQLKKSLTQMQIKDYEEALAQRNRLLEYNESSEKRTTIIDDEADYFKTSSTWLSDEERKRLVKLENEMREKKHVSRLSKKVTLDFASRQLVDEPLDDTEENEILREIVAMENTQAIDYVYNDSAFSRLDSKFSELYSKLETAFEENILELIPSPNVYQVYNKVQDKEMLELSDMTSCLSMHQPWASLLIAGIKKHEGRTWYTPHRGRLWIASTVKSVTREDIIDMENFYRVYSKGLDEILTFPTQYPTGCLLGFVLVHDCLPQEEYQKIYPDGESTSPYVIICSDFHELPVHFPVKGQHKIYKLDPQIHTAALKAIQRLNA